jgi:hypothetical protein
VTQRRCQTWILTGSLDNFRASRERGFDVVGLKEGRRRMAEQVESGDRVVFYVTGIQAFGAIARITGELYEDRTPIWPGKPGKRDDYPWRFPAQPELVLDENGFVPAAELAPRLEHVRKWPAEHWQLAFQGQLRTVSDADARVIEDRLREHDEQAREAPDVGAGDAAAGANRRTSAPA